MTVYLDHATTSAIRPDAVPEAMASYLRACGGNPSAGGHSVAREADRVVTACRQALLRILGLPSEGLALMPNATTALNTAFWGVLGQGDAVVVSAYDHNAVRRPVAGLARSRGVEVRMLDGSPDGEIDLDQAERLVSGARLVVINVVSNVLGHRMPVEALSERARAAGALVLVDVAQAAGHLPLALGEVADLVAFTGHKGLLGPQGTGGLWVRNGVDLPALLSGGNAGDPLATEMPGALPGRLEAGTPNVPGLAGLLAAVEFLENEGIGRIHAREARLKAALRSGLAAIPSVRVLSPPAPDGNGIVLLNTDRLDPATLADRLDREWGVMTKPGLHNAPDAHRILGTLEQGAVRVSVGWCTTEADVDRALEAVEAVVSDAST